VKKKISQKIE